MRASQIRASWLAVSAVLLLCGLPFAAAQVHGVPASVTSFGFGGNFSPTPGVPASVTSLGPNGFGNSPRIFGGFGSCCFNPVISGNFHPPVFHSRGFHHRHHFFGGIPVFSVPYTPVIVVQPGAEDYADYAEEEDAPGPTIFDRNGALWQRFTPRQPQPAPATASAPVATPSAQPTELERIVAQPNTVLVFKDGHQSEVQNYAIVSNTLFDVSEGRTHKIQLADLDLAATQKANDDRGVDFKVPVTQ